MRRLSALWVTVMLAAAALGAGTGCAPRQVVVESESPVTGGQASVERLRSELQRLASAQSDYYRVNGRYADALGPLAFEPASGVRVDIVQGDRSGFSATATAGTAECAIYSGAVRAPRSYLTSPDVVACRP